MKRRILAWALALALLLSLLPAAVHAGGGSDNVWSDDFNDGSISDWLVIDADNDGFGLRPYSSGSERAIKAAVNSDGEIGEYADDYMISPEIYLPACGENELTFKVMADKAAGPNSHIDLYIIDGSIPASQLNAGLLMKMRPSEFYIPGEDYDWHTLHIDLGAYGGQQIRLVFHYWGHTYYQVLRMDDVSVDCHEYDSHIERTTVTNVPFPEVGRSVSELSEDDIELPNPFLYELVPGSLKYWKSDGYNEEEFNGTFAEGDQYRITLQLRPKEDAFTYDNVAASINGIRAGYYRDRNGTEEDQDDILNLSYNYGVLKQTKNEVRQINIVNVREPLAGREIGRNADGWMPDGSPCGYRVANVVWTPYGNDYLPGETYKVEVQCFLDEGCYLSEHPIVTLNGKVATLRDNGDGAFFVSRTFDKVPVNDPRHYFVQQPKNGVKTKYTHFRMDWQTDVPPDEVHLLRDTHGDGSFSEDLGVFKESPCYLNEDIAPGESQAYRLRADWDDLVDSAYTDIFVVTGVPDIEGPLVSVVPPVAGQTPQYIGKTNKSTFHVGWVSWAHVNGDGSDGATMSSTEAFEAGKTYKVTVFLVPEAGYGLGNDSNVRINNQEAQPVNKEPSGEMSYSVKLACLPSEDCTVSFCGSYFGEAPDPVSCTVGDSFNLPTLPSQPGWIFAGWGYSPYATEDECLSGSYLVTGDAVLYAVWLEEITHPVVALQTPGAGDDGTGYDIYVDYHEYYDVVADADEQVITWWTSALDVGDADRQYKGIFKPGKTYYGAFALKAEDCHVFSADAGKNLSLDGVVVDEAVPDGRWLRIKFHVTVPSDGQINAAAVYIVPMVPGSYANVNTACKLICQTPGISASGMQLWEELSKVGQESDVYDGRLTPGKTFYSMMYLSGRGGTTLAKNIELTLTGGKELKRESFEYSLDNDVYVYFSLQVPPTGDLTARSYCPTGGVHGWFRSDYSQDWHSYIEGPYTPAGEHEFLAMADAGYVFKGWHVWTLEHDGALLSTDNPYHLTLGVDDAIDMEAWFVKSWRVSFLNAHGDNPPAQVVESGGCAVEPKGLADPDYTFTGWYTDPTCQHLYNFSTPVTSDLILYSGWNYTPGAGVDKSALDKAIKDAEAIDTSCYTVESVTTLSMVLTGAKMVQSASGATQADVDAAVENIKDAVAALELLPGAVDKNGLRLLIADAEEKLQHKEQYTDASVAALENALESAKSYYYGALTQEAVDAAASDLEKALNALQYNTPFRFDDVKDEGKFYFAPVYWAYGHDPQITNGVDTTHFAPDKTCTRAQVVAFLWRAKGCPEPGMTECPFKDVKKGAYYEKAVLWAVENNITNGVNETHFGPDNGCTRAQVVTFLWRAVGSPEPGTTESPFVDVTGGYYYKAVLWAVENNVTNGVDPTHFVPGSTCTRGQIVTFLKRAIEP